MPHHRLPQRRNTLMLLLNLPPELLPALLHQNCHIALPQHLQRTRCLVHVRSHCQHNVLAVTTTHLPSQSLVASLPPRTVSVPGQIRDVHQYNAPHLIFRESTQLLLPTSPGNGQIHTTDSVRNTPKICTARPKKFFLYASKANFPNCRNRHPSSYLSNPERQMDEPINRSC